ncbi:hypothetical protein KUM_1055 [Taylorella asinigenitalis 14/45]|uniref:Uncharacterized protein n=2 Tax=Taylorella asinigenitalis TaxID=84590 RepID=G4QCA7_TAYAM|nr:hypothetical protein [Taylorella asinigenitalis]AEP37076.1 hypothetical protein TASI_1333 [Taylorella asinigenitalis MCE3]CCG19840.1 hypothetical protein KUM_1055 [Taylorella asinigenitalis 14/45]
MDNKAKLEALAVQANIDRRQVVNGFYKLRDNLDPEVIADYVMARGRNLVSSALPDASGAFSWLGRNPRISVGIAKGLLNLAKTKNRLLRTVALGVASWFISKRFK